MAGKGAPYTVNTFKVQDNVDNSNDNEDSHTPQQQHHNTQPSNYPNGMGMNAYFNQQQMYRGTKSC
jgi:hypothetical protein